MSIIGNERKTAMKRMPYHKRAEPKLFHNRQTRTGQMHGKEANLLRSQKGDISIYTCFFIVAAVMLVSFLLLYASIRITCINIRNGARMELNNLSASIYADTFRSQRETNFSWKRPWLTGWQTKSPSPRMTIPYGTSGSGSVSWAAAWNIPFPAMPISSSGCSGGSTLPSQGT